MPPIIFSGTDNSIVVKAERVSAQVEVLTFDSNNSASKQKNKEWKRK
jgi:hypothetical protein